MEAQRFSNDYAEKQISKFHQGELTHNQISELMDILAQRVRDNRQVQRSLITDQRRQEETHHEIGRLAKNLGVDVNELRGFTTLGALRFLNRKAVRRDLEQPSLTPGTRLVMTDANGNTQAWEIANEVSPAI